MTPRCLVEGNLLEIFNYLYLSPHGSVSFVTVDHLVFTVMTLNFNGSSHSKDDLTSFKTCFNRGIIIIIIIICWFVAFISENDS